jgi:hypothetical protein
MPSSATDAWRTQDAERDPRRRALASALLAPNAHNRQSWLVDLDQPNVISLHVDTERLLPETDPPSRQITISQGTFLEVLVMALAHEGLAADVALFPEGEYGEHPDGRPVARIDLKAAAPREDPLFASVPLRRTNRSPFDDQRAVATASLETIAAASARDGVTVKSTNDPKMRDPLREHVRRAWDIEVETPAKALESIRLTRIGASDIDAHRDGISITGFFPWFTKQLGFADEATVLDPSSTAHGIMRDLGRDGARTAMAFVWFETNENRRADQVAVGRAYVRAHLQATALGLAWHPMSQGLQEYREMDAARRDIHAALGVPWTGERPERFVQMLARVGYASPVDAAPRRPLASIVRRG